jgi:cobalamin biosynthesis Mg chelatase CobN
MFKPVFKIAALTLTVSGAAWADDASLLGPQTSTPSSSQSTTGPASPQTSGVLQPAGVGDSSSLQSADATAGGANQSGNGQALQQTNGSDASKLLVQGEADQPHDVKTNLSLTQILALVVVAGLAAGGAWWLWRERPRKSTPDAHQDTKADTH